MKIALLTTQDLDADPFADDDWPCDPRPFLPEADWDVVTLQKSDCVDVVSRLTRNGYDLFFNLCDGAADEDKPGIEVVETLEAANVPFTGATSVFYEPTREQMKAACHREGIATPRGLFVRSEDDVDRAIDRYTDRHPVVRRARRRLPPELRRVGGILVDGSVPEVLAHLRDARE